MKTPSKNKNGFTLIELLVVISIIAMLLAILMPALGAVKMQARRVVCMSNLSQWGLIFTLYTEDHDGHFFAGFYDYTDPNGGVHTSSDPDLWPYAMESYYQVSKLKFCPSATKPHSDKYASRYRSRSPWGDQSDRILSGSYGLNGWVCDTPKEIPETQGHDTANSWRTMDIFGSGRIPLMADALWYTGRPEPTDLPPITEGQFDGNEPDKDTNHMRRFTVDRHSKKTNVLFMDGMVGSISPKKLWRLKWHKKYNAAALPEWPEWMSSFKEPD